jgi:hypothetical protein
MTTSSGHAADWLRSFLAEFGPIASGLVKPAAIQAGYSSSTIKCAAARVGVKVTIVATPRGRASLWELTEPTPAEPTPGMPPVRSPRRHRALVPKLRLVGPMSRTPRLHPVLQPEPAPDPREPGTRCQENARALDLALSHASA